MFSGPELKTNGQYIQYRPFTIAGIWYPLSFVWALKLGLDGVPGTSLLVS